MRATATDFHLRLPPEISERIALFSKERGVSRNMIVISALEEFLNIGDARSSREDQLEGVRKEVFEIKRRVVALREDVEIVGELLSFFIYHWIGYTPRLEREERLSLAAEAKERHDRFLSLFTKKLATGELSLAAVFGAGEKLNRVETEKSESDLAQGGGPHGG
jgi:predicted DNA-binding protein